MDLEPLIRDTLPLKTGNLYTSWNIDLLYCNLNGSYPSLPSDSNQDLIQRHGDQLLQLREQRKTRKIDHRSESAGIDLDRFRHGSMHEIGRDLYELESKTEIIHSGLLSSAESEPLSPGERF